MRKPRPIFWLGRHPRRAPLADYGHASNWFKLVHSRQRARWRALGNLGGYWTFHRRQRAAVMQDRDALRGCNYFRITRARLRRLGYIYGGRGLFWFDQAHQLVVGRP